MRIRFLFLILIFVSFVFGCSSLQNDPKNQIYGNITGPSEINEGQSVSYTMDAGGAPNLTFLWSCEPANAGSFSSINTFSTTFTAATVNETITVNLMCVVDGDNADQLIKSMAVNILNLD